jgi:hypothetical protein
MTADDTMPRSIDDYLAQLRHRASTARPSSVMR